MRVAGNAQVLTLLMLWITDNEQGVAVAVGVDCAARHGVARSACSVRHGAAVGSRLARALLALTALF